MSHVSDETGSPGRWRRCLNSLTTRDDRPAPGTRGEPSSAERREDPATAGDRSRCRGIVALARRRARGGLDNLDRARACWWTAGTRRLSDRRILYVKSQDTVDRSSSFLKAWRPRVESHDESRPDTTDD